MKSGDRGKRVLMVARRCHEPRDQMAGPQRATHELYLGLRNLEDCTVDILDPKMDLFAIVRAIVTHSAQLLYLGDQSPWSILVAVLGRAFKLPVVTTVHGWYLVERRHSHRAWYLVLAQIIIVGLCSRIVVLSKTQAETIGYTSKISVVPNGCKVVETLNGVRPERKLRIYSKDDSFIRVMMIGGGRAEKGLPFLIRTLEGIPRSITLYVFGDRGEDAHWLNYRSKTLRVVYKGSISQRRLWLYVRCCHVYVQPSMWEPFGMAALEALCLGVPVVISDRCGVGEHLGALVNDLHSPVRLVPFGDQEKFRLAVTELASGRCHRPVRYEDVAHLSWNSVASEYKRLFTEEETK